MIVFSLTFDSAIGITGLVAIVAAGFYALRYKATLEAAQASARAWQGERDAEAAHRGRLEAQLDSAKERISELEGRVDELSRRPDLTVIQTLMEKHEDRAQIRAEKTLEVLSEIAGAVRRVADEDPRLASS